MPLQSGRHQEVLAELTEWREDLAQRHIGSQVVVLAVPSGWGRSAVLDEFAAAAENDDGPVTLVIPIDGALPPGRAVQADALREDLAAAARSPRVVSLLGLDTAAGKIQLGLGAAGLLASGPAAAASLLVASLGVTAAGNAWDTSPAGEQGAVARAARAARAVAALSVEVPVVVTIDDADQLDPDLALTLIRNLTARHNSQVLTVAAAAPGSDLATTLATNPGYDLNGRVHRADTNPAMAYRDRADLAAELLPHLPAPATERIARRTGTFKEVITIAAAGRLTELGPGTTTALETVDTIADAVLDRGRPSAAAVILAWAGGTLHTTQLNHTLHVDLAQALPGLTDTSPGADPRVTLTGPLIRLAGPADTRLNEQMNALPPNTRHQLAAAVLTGTAQLASDPDTGLAERVIARQAVHHVRADLTDRTSLPQIQCALVRGLEKLGDSATAHHIATTALAELPDAAAGSPHHHQLQAAVLRLARTSPDNEDDPLAAEAIALALAGGATTNLEARVWAAVDLLNRPRHRQTALTLATQVTTELQTSRIDGAAAQWRLLLAYHTGRAGHPDLTQRLLAKIVNTGTTSQQEAAQAILYAVGGPHADTRLQITILQAQLDQTPDLTDDDQLRIHHTLATAHNTLGEYQRALHHARHELTLRHHTQNPHHPDTLTNRNNIAQWTGQVGDLTRALQLSEELLPDLVRILGASHPDTLTTRGNIALWAGDCGDPARALRLYEELLPEVARILGASHPHTLTTRNNIAYWTEKLHGGKQEPGDGEETSRPPNTGPVPA